jgi:hypothetical protein
MPRWLGTLGVKCAGHIFMFNERALKQVDRIIGGPAQVTF